MKSGTHDDIIQIYSVQNVFWSLHKSQEEPRMLIKKLLEFTEIQTEITNAGIKL